ncbi:RNA polymerase sigma-70 factor (sigma-E family) [Kibdelosporangium banguiense]|uniref:RNA polymerase sigma-70 factor (Sigma-E family) n=1 Tax=Kibdelosporangium banguiense TaxID=1365924 RepID=A0ABS4TBD6_9PSEU|nr:SigE family RNA polymerase sigma factor [Kibdelosporangium banguiense]MBP2321734.1 RNA polymerase sigma-70 factor (sigma-E family) [Kibdelosporangium banguiense]
MARFDKEFAEFFSARFDKARRIAYAMCGDWVEAEEIAQNGFVRLYSHWPKVANTNPDAYLRTVLTRLFLDTRRRGRKREQLVAELPEVSMAADDSSEDRQTLVAALQYLPPKQRAVVVLRIVQDLSVEQVAAAMRCSEGTVKSQTARGLQALRAAYEKVTASSGCA